MAYTAPAHSYWASFHNVYGCLHHAHQRYQLHLPYKSHRTYLTNQIVSISHHIMPLVINSLRGRHTHRRPHRTNFKKPGACRPQVSVPGLQMYMDECYAHTTIVIHCQPKHVL